MFKALTIVLCLWTLFLVPFAHAGQGDVDVRTSASVRLISAENGVAPDASTLSLGLMVEMEPGWKTYWRSPGEVGLPPEIVWTSPDTVAGATLFFPAPERFTAFDIENFGYSGTVIFPIEVTLTDPGAPAQLTAEARLLVCADICIPEDFSVSLDLPSGTDIDQKAASLLSDADSKVPLMPEEAGLISLTAYVDDSHLTLLASRDRPFLQPDVFPELGDDLDPASFGKPLIRLSDGGRTLWAEFPTLYRPDVEHAVDITITDSEWAVTGTAAMVAHAPAAPASSTLLWMLMVALAGGLLLNVMPCVLPVLSLKIGYALERSVDGPARVRAGFLASSVGIIMFMWGLAAVTLSMKSMGQAVGWGMQFQNPGFLGAMVLLIALFAANMAGLFEINLPASWQTQLGGPQSKGLAGDFATGAFAAVMATPCSAPFLGTAVAFAMAGSSLETWIIFTALGLGLALPYLVFALRPGLLRALPRPGAWMTWVKWVLAGLLALTAVWLLSVLWRAAGAWAAGSCAGAAVALVALVSRPWRGRAIAAGMLLALGAVLPSALADTTPMAQSTKDNWVAFDRNVIDARVAEGQVVFVDVTADWCLTCKANKRLVLDRAPTSDLLTSDDVVAMLADWTRPSDDITAYLQSFGRYGIPFNAVYGPGAPLGIPLPEVLSADAIAQAIAQAR
ncbi:MAG: thioredoxin family protein [Marinovum sp.]|nr:thioredoxin family protein [Marinovum sp.]